MKKSEPISYHLKDLIAKAVAESFDGLKISPEAISVEHPTLEAFGDYSSNVALVLAKQLNDNPRKIAEKLVENLAQNVSKELVSKIDIAGAGFINFEINGKFLTKEVEEVLKEKD